MDKIIPYVEPIHAESVTGQPLYYRINGDLNALTIIKTEHPLMISQLELFLERSNDSKLTEKMEPYEASRFRFKLRRSLRTQHESGSAQANGWKIEDVVYKKFLDAIMTPESKLVLEGIRFNVFPFEESVVNATNSELSDETSKAV